jgi:hypothetical protein
LVEQSTPAAIHWLAQVWLLASQLGAVVALQSWSWEHWQHCAAPPITQQTGVVGLLEQSRPAVWHWLPQVWRLASQLGAVGSVQSRSLPHCQQLPLPSVAGIGLADGQGWHTVLLVGMQSSTPRLSALQANPTGQEVVEHSATQTPLAALEALL